VRLIILLTAGICSCIGIKCNTSTFIFFYKGIWNAGDTLNKPEINSWVDYFDANGLWGFIIGPVENGCQLISASSIKTVTNCVTCTISTITYPFCDGTTYVTGRTTGRQYDDFRCGEIHVF
jgi:hypothetical protein